jgi:hypothetical protein
MWGHLNGKSRDMLFEGTTREASDFLSGILTKVTDVPGGGRFENNLVRNAFPDDDLRSSDDFLIFSTSHRCRGVWPYIHPG